MARVVQRDQQAFAQLYDRWSARLLALTVQVLVDRAQSEEVLQEVFLEAWRRADTYDPTLGSVRAWLVTLTCRRAIDRVRASQSARDRENRWHGTMPDADVTVQQVEDRLEGEEVRQALDAVGEPHRSTLLLAYFSGLTHTEIATRTGVPLGTVKTRIRDGIAKLRTHMGVEL
ncbi:sigma-70 family RNA polymerase sigma factor [Actinomyces bovis]|nr:sigma-70 family RNA polymerase sigma factor [Actinomyces bovis]